MNAKFTLILYVRIVYNNSFDSASCIRKAALISRCNFGAAFFFGCSRCFSLLFVVQQLFPESPFSLILQESSPRIQRRIVAHIEVCCCLWHNIRGCSQLAPSFKGGGRGQALRLSKHITESTRFTTTNACVRKRQGKTYLVRKMSMDIVRRK